MNNIFDSHAHYSDEKFSEDRYAVLDSLFSGGVTGIIECGCDIKSSVEALALSEKYAGIFAACGIHPHECEGASFDNDIPKLTEMLKREKCVAIGEIGLDYHYDFSPRDVQRDWFERQIQLSLELDMPIIVHDREAHEDTMNLLKKYRPKGVVHCFSGSVETAREVIDLGMYIGLGGAVTFKNAKKPLEVAAYVPAQRLLIETDCPYMAPVPFRGNRCDSSMIPYAAEIIASVRGTAPQEILDLTAQNARALFNIK
ncbi:MAG: TatD family hydrolase [Clostridiales bacterium]|nr:TatD family hydrolase [Clostridiales bacterium]